MFPATRKMPLLRPRQLSTIPAQASRRTREEPAGTWSKKLKLRVGIALDRMKTRRHLGLVNLVDAMRRVQKKKGGCVK